MLPAFHFAPQALDVVGRGLGRRGREDRLSAGCGVGERDALVHDAGELAAGLAELRLRLAREPAYEPLRRSETIFRRDNVADR
jgi:hypothetical protein